MHKMKDFLFQIIISSYLLGSNALADELVCPQIAENDGGIGGGISSVGGGGAGYALSNWFFGASWPKPLPQLLHLRRAGEDVGACLYDRHFGDTDTPVLVSQFLCEQTVIPTDPSDTDSYLIRCTADAEGFHYAFHARMVDLIYVGILKRGIRQGNDSVVWHANAMFIGH